jgi:hypothetical protein
VKAELTLREGRNSEALAEIDDALALAPNDPEVRITRARPECPRPAWTSYYSTW